MMKRLIMFYLNIQMHGDGELRTSHTERKRERKKECEKEKGKNRIGRHREGSGKKKKHSFTDIVSAHSVRSY